MTTFNKLISIIALASVLAISSQAQNTTTSTTFSAAVGGPTATAPAPTTVCLASATGVSAPGFGNPAQTALFSDHEYMTVLAATGSTTCFVVARGQSGTSPYAHASGELVWVGPAGGGASSTGLMGLSPFRQSDPQGGAGSPCTSTAEAYLPQVTAAQLPSYPLNGGIWDCPASGPGASTWVKRTQPVSPVSAMGGPYYAIAGGANNALTVKIAGITVADGLRINLKMDGTHTLQAGANTIAFNGGSALALKSHFNTATDIGTAYAATGVLPMLYNATLGGWVDLSQ